MTPVFCRTVKVTLVSVRLGLVWHLNSRENCCFWNRQMKISALNEEPSARRQQGKQPMVEVGGVGNRYGDLWLNSAWVQYPRWRGAESQWSAPLSSPLAANTSNRKPCSWSEGSQWLMRSGVWLGWLKSVMISFVSSTFRSRLLPYTSPLDILPPLCQPVPCHPEWGPLYSRLTSHPLTAWCGWPWTWTLQV